MDADKLKELLDEQAPRIVQQVREKVVENVSANVTREIEALTLAEVKKHFVEHIAPEIAKTLLEENGAILDAVRQASSLIAVQLATEMHAKAAANLAHSWNVRDITNKLFG